MVCCIRIIIKKALFICSYLNYQYVGVFQNSETIVLKNLNETFKLIFKEPYIIAHSFQEAYTANEKKYLYSALASTIEKNYILIIRDCPLIMNVI